MASGPEDENNLNDAKIKRKKVFLRQHEYHFLGSNFKLSLLSSSPVSPVFVFEVGERGMRASIPLVHTGVKMQR